MIRSPKEKIKTLKELKDILENVRDELPIITTNGVYDLIHPGHIDTFYKAKSLGGILIVGVNSDESVKTYKTPNRPILNENDRALIVASIGYVDLVTIFNESTPNKFLDIVKPKYHVKSKTGYLGLERDVVLSNGGGIVLVDDLEGYSSGKIVERAFEVYYKDHIRRDLN